MKLVSIKPSTREGKKYVATICLCCGDSICEDKKKKKVHFGQEDSKTFVDHQDNKIKDAYLKRHKVNENWNNPTTPGALSRYILWNKSTIKSSILDFKKRFNLL